MAIKSRAKYTSKGERPSVSPKTKVKATGIDQWANKWKAFLSGKKVYMTIPNPSLKEGPEPINTNKRFIRVTMASVYGDFRKYQGNKSVIGGR